MDTNRAREQEKNPPTPVRYLDEEKGENQGGTTRESGQEIVGTRALTTHGSGLAGSGFTGKLSCGAGLRKK